MTDSSDLSRLRPFISHEDDPRGPTDDLILRRHLEQVSSRALSVLSPATAEVRQTVQLAANLHDFGKTTPEFQRYIRSGETHRGPRWERRHARLGALVTFHVLGQAGVSTRNQWAGFLAVAKHHGSAPNLLEYIQEDVIAFERENEAVKQQVASIDDAWPDAADTLLRTITDDRVRWADVCAMFGDDQPILDALEDAITTEVFGSQVVSSAAIPTETYDRFYRLWSALTLADKTHAAGITASDLEPRPVADRPLKPLTDHIKGLQADPKDDSALEVALDRARERARQYAHSSLSGATGIPAATGGPPLEESAPDILTLPLPTGLGKTFTGLSVAIDLQDRLAESPQMTSLPPIIYALPYTSIIEQTRRHIEGDTIWGADPSSHQFTVDHYLSETRTDPSETVEDDPEQYSETDDTTKFRDHAALLGSAWRSGVVLTTFVQLFESLSRPTSKSAMKGVSLSNAVVVLDEPQALPVRWWPAIRRLCHLLRDEFGTTILSMTATQPPLFATDEFETHSLVDDQASYYDRFERVTYDIDESVWQYSDPDAEFPGPVGYDDAATRVAQSVTQDAESVLAVCNTVASAQTLYQRLTRDLEAPIRLGQQLGSVLANWDGAEAISNQLSAPPEELSPDSLSLSPGDLAPDPDAVADHLLAWLDDLDPAADRPAIVCLTGDHRPFDKSVLIRLIDALTTGDRPFVTVSTQVIEAGVDVSFRTVYRDHAPVPDIVQSAGRCNRSFEWGPSGGAVRVWQLAAPPDGIRPARVYEYGELKDHLEITARTLREACERPASIPEKTVARRAVEAYYSTLTSRGVGEDALATRLDDFCAADMGSETLIEDVGTVDIVAPRTAVERSVVSAARAAFSREDLSLGYHLLAALQDTRVSVVETALASEPMSEITPDASTTEVYSLTGTGNSPYDPEFGVWRNATDPP